MTAYIYRGDQPDATCGEKNGTITGAHRHRRAGQRPCSNCLEAEREYKRAYRRRRVESAETLENRRQRNRARQRALIALAQRHRAEFHGLMRREMAGVISETLPGAQSNGQGEGNLSSAPWPEADSQQGIDLVAVHRALDGDPPAQITKAERREIVRLAYESGMSGAETALRTGIHERTVSRIRRELFRESERVTA